MSLRPGVGRGLREKAPGRVRFGTKFRVAFGRTDATLVMADIVLLIAVVIGLKLIC